MRTKLLILFLICFSFFSFAQKKSGKSAIEELIRPTLSKKQLKQLKIKEDSMAVVSWKIVNDSLVDDKRKAAMTFIPILKRALSIDNSFFYPFDSLKTVSILYPPDSTFRILTWQLYYAQGKTRYFGVIQMRSTKMKIFPLYDKSDSLPINCQAVLNPEIWWGQLYYNIIQKTINGKNVYTLFGFESADVLQRRKIIDILSFDENKNPKFGAPLFYYKYEDTTNRSKATDTLHRMFMAYKWSARTILNFDEELDMIVFDHVSPPDPKAKDATFMYVPDGTYEGFIWKNDRWNWVEKVFTFAINENDNPPIPVPLFGKPERQPNLEPEKGPKK